MLTASATVVMFLFILPAVAAVITPLMVPLVSAIESHTLKTCPIDSPLSCHLKSGTKVDSCCVNTPGGFFLQTQFWDYSPAVGPNTSWTIHGLWPDRCDGSFDQFCDRSRTYHNISSILKSFGEKKLLGDMEKYWKDMNGKDESIWEHEWSKHGTCISTLEPQCLSGYKPQQEVVEYFQKTVDLFKGLDSYEALSKAGIVPSKTKTYRYKDIQKALRKTTGAQPAVRCHGTYLNEIWYFFNVKGSVISGKFVPASPDGSKTNCPKSGIRYMPKDNQSHSPDGPKHPGAKEPFEGKGYLVVSEEGWPNGCLIKNGRWYSSGGCAVYTATPGEDGFYLKTKKGRCGLLKGAFACGGGAEEQLFKDKNGTLTMFADAVPSGKKQVPVFIKQEKKGHALEVAWQSK